MSAAANLEISWIQGFTKDNVEFVDNKTACYRCGNHISFLNLETKTQSVFQSPGRGVGALTANGSSGTFAFSDRKLSPSIFVYDFPDLNLRNELKGNARLDYTSLTLSDGCPYLGSCSSFPEFTITVWNWEDAEVICTQSPAGPDVLSLKFNPMNWFQLCALGTTTLTIWNIERFGTFHLMTPRLIHLPAASGSSSKKLPPTPIKNPNVFTPEAISEFSKTKPSSVAISATVTPSALCWTTTSQLYVGCAEGYLLLVDPEDLSVSVLFDPADADGIPELQNFSFLALTIHSNGIIAVGNESEVHRLQIRGTQTSITQTWKLDRPVSTAVLSPDNDTLLLSSITGQIYLLNPAHSGQIEKVLDVLSGNFLAAALLHSDKNVCVSLREHGVLQLWSSDGNCLSSLPLQTEVTSLACCPIAHYTAVGTASGKVLFIDLNNEKQARLVHEVHLYHAAVEHLVFDPKGQYLLCSGSDLHLFVLNTRPSTRFSVIGYIDVPGSILSLSTQCIGSSDGLRVLVLCASEQDEKEDGSLLMMFSLPFRSIEGPDWVDRRGCLYNLKVFRYKVPLPLTSCALGVGEVFAYCHRNKSLQQFHLPEDTDGLSSQQMIQLNLKKKVRGHPLGPATLLLSPDCMWLASVGQEGLLRIRPTASMENYWELWCHSWRLGGVRTVSFSDDGCTLITTGFQDGSLLCTKLRTKDVYNEANRDFIKYHEDLSMKITFSTENPVLVSLPVWGQDTPVSCRKTEETELRCATSIDVTEQDESYLPTATNSTWLESRQEEIVKEDNKLYSETRQNLKETVRELRETIQKMLFENESLPMEMFNLDEEEQKRLEAMVEEEVTKVKAEIEQDIRGKCFLRDVLKRECWDSWMIKSRSIKAFHSEMAVENYPLKERTEEELEDLRRVQNMRKIEKAACRLSGLKERSSGQEGEQKEEGHEADSAALSGRAELVYTSPYIYNQFTLKTVEQRINQITLLKDLIYDIKMDFNSDFEALHRRKVQELRRLHDRNKNIREIMLELDMKQELWEPSLTEDEWPERLFSVDDSEIKAEKYLTPEQEKEEERRRLEESRLTAQSDDSRERALDDMMKGVLEVKKVDILKMEVPPPEFVLAKPESQWSKEEKKLHNEYERNMEEKENYKRTLKAEMKKLQESIKDSTQKFDETLTKLLEKKLQATNAIYQEQLKITYLADSVLAVEQMNNQEQEIRLKLEQLLAKKMGTEKDLMRYEDEVKQFQYEYESIVAEDNALDKDFRKGFPNLPNHVVDQLYKLFKRRPRVQRLRAQAENASNLFRLHHLNDSQTPDGLSQMLTAMEELDAPENTPEGLKLSIWERFCFVRRTKVEMEQRMKMKALNLAEMQTFLQRRRDEDNAAQEEIKQLFEALRSLQKTRNQHLTNTTVQLILKQEQVETSATDWTDEADFIALHASEVDNHKMKIQMVAEQKIALMEARRDEISKVINQLEWEQRVQNQKIEDLTDKKKHIKMLRLSKDQQDMKFGSKKEHAALTLKNISKMEESIAFMEKANKNKIQQRMKEVKWLKKETAKIEKKDAALEKQHCDLPATVAELRQVYQAEASEKNEAAEREERHREIVRRRNLEDRARAQSEHLDVLWREVERLERRNFPSLDQLKYTW